MRLRSIRPKSGGATIRVLHNRHADPADNLAGKIERYARIIASLDSAESRLDGFLIIGLYDNGCTNVGFHMPERLPLTLATAFLAETIRRDLVTQNEARAVFDEKFEWREQ